MELLTSEIKTAAGTLRAGDRILLSGTVYTARDAAHKRLFELLDQDLPLPFDIDGAIIYYAGPTPGKNGMPVGSCGPTTSARMNSFSPRLYDLGLAAAIGKGAVADTVSESIIRNKAVYLCAIGGAGALIARCIKTADEIAFPELGCESVKRLTIEKLPLTVGIDCIGGNIFLSGRSQYKLG